MTEQEDLAKEIKENIIFFNDLYHIKGIEEQGFKTIEETVKAYIKKRDKKQQKTTKLSPNKIVIKGRVLELSEYERLDDDE